MSTYRLGTTSYIIPDDILPNVNFLADQVDDIELILFEADSASNLPSPQIVEEIGAIAQEHDLSFTVHLPLDLRLGADGDEQHVSLQKAKRVIELTRSLKPFAYVLHLDGRDVTDYTGWLKQAVRALEITAEWAGGRELLAVENLEGYPLDFWEPVFDAVEVSRCVDIGHLWLDDHDAMAYLQRAFARTSVIHLHGIGSRDHQSLAHMPEAKIEQVVTCLDDLGYAGVLTLEVFNQPDFSESKLLVQKYARDI